MKPWIQLTWIIFFLPTCISAFLSVKRTAAARHSKSIVQLFEQDIPANLKRKVQAKRPPLGYIVPRHVRNGTGGTANPKLRPQGKARAAGLNNPSMLQITAGSAKGKRLDSPTVYLRPMMGKVREAVYSTLISLGLYDTNVRHLDIFSGSGSVGLESLSRGATFCTFVDLSQDCCSAIQRNLAWCDFSNTQAEVICADAYAALDGTAFSKHSPQESSNDSRSYHLVTLCPPYEQVIYADLLQATVDSPLVMEDTIVLVEYPVELGCLPHVISATTGTTKMVGLRNRKYGRTVIAIYIVNPTGKLEGAQSRPEEFVSLSKKH